jgi:photosystem II stability/assembly factor-like uncharacterized protein
MTTLYVTLEQALAVVRRKPGTWQVDLQPAVDTPHCLAVDPSHPERVYCGTFGGGIWRSLDAGRSWYHLDQGLSQSQITAMAVSPVEQVNGLGVVYAGSEPSALFRSEDGGDTWRELNTLLHLPSAPTWRLPPRPETSHVRWITPDPLKAGRLFVAIEAGALVRSQDGGETWEDRQPDGPIDTLTLIMHRLAPNHLFSAAGDGGFLGPGKGFVESQDGGESWYRSGEGMQHHYLWSVAADPADPSTLVVSAAAGPQRAHNFLQADSTLYRRSGSDPWQQVRAGLPPSQGTLTSVLATQEAESGVFYAANNHGVFRSGDTGNTWESLPIPWPEGAKLGWARALVVQES